MTSNQKASNTLLVKKHLAINKKWWNKATPVHARSKLYQLSSFKKGKTSLQQTEIKEVGNVKGKTFLHLLCHFGMDSLSWSRRGAIVTGVDFSSTSINLAQKLSKEIQVPATFIKTDIYDLPKVLDEKFDIIFASYGVLLWLSSMKKFAKIVNHFLKDNGMFYIIELHPFTNILSSEFKLFYKYFEKGPFLDNSDGSYTNWENTSIKGETYEWSHTISDLLNPLISEGLRIEYIHEFPFTMYDQFPGFMKNNKKGQYVLKDKKIQIPLLFSLKATKNAKILYNYPMNNGLVAKTSIVINSPIGKVWEALVNPKMIKQYLFGTNVFSDWKVGSPIIYKGEWQGKHYEDKGKILEFIPEKLFASTYWSSMGGKEDKEENYATVIYHLQKTEGKTKVTLTQDNNATKEDKIHSEENWKIVLNGLKKLLEK